MDPTNNYLELLRFCLNEDQPVPECIKDINWHELLIFATKHAIIGMYLPTILMENGRLKKDDFMGNKPSDEDVMEWVFEGHRLRKNNTTLFGRTQKASEWFLENGFRNCILKGQGNALMYPDPYMRTCGDIDIWLEGGREKILQFTTKYYSSKDATRIHVDFPMFSDAEVEVHFTPSTLKNPFTNKKLQKYFKEKESTEFGRKVTSADGRYSFFVPSNEFNTLYQLIHMYRHLIKRGVGLRQVIDYFYLLKKRKHDGISPDANKQLIATLKKFHLYKFARAMAYILHEMLGLSEEYLYVSPDKKEGLFIINEILEGGNFGKFETRLNGMSKAHNHFKRFWILESFNLRLLSHYPSETIWMPYMDLRRSIQLHFNGVADEDDD